MFTSFLELLKRVFFLTGYFQNGSYPQPLSAEEEAKCLKRMQEGSASARDKLICHNMRLVAHIAKKYGKNDLDDLISIGSIGLIKGVESYSTDKGTTLATYLARCIENEILMTLRSNKRYQNTVYLQSTLGVDNDGNEYTLMDVLSTNEDSVFQQAETSILRQNLLKLIKERLNEREQKIILMRYGLEENSVPLTQLQTAKKLGISRSYISRIETRALEKLRQYIEE
ncbi:MAG: RNA polymerase sporulation sigma factor SigK [Clostridia bacterium]|nr:RNA polymerase sporulation sigma factor SigK [Clostridia bacterium]